MSRIAQDTRLFFAYAWYSYRALFTLLDPESYLVLKILNPLAQVLFFTLLGQAVGKDPAYYVIGNSTQLAVTSGILGVIGVISMERRMGTLSQLMITPTSNAFTFYGRSVFLIFDGLTSMAVGFLAGLLIFHLNFAYVNWLWFIVALVVICFAVSGLGLVLGVFGFIGTDLNVGLNLAMALLLVICGVNFPVENLPLPLQWVASLLPLTHGLKAIRTIFTGQTTGVLENIALEFLIGCAYMALGYVIFAICEYIARKQGTIDFY